MNIKEKINKFAATYSNEIISLRRTLHQNPELSFNEFETSALVLEKITKLKIDSVKRIASTGVTGLIKGNGKGRIAFCFEKRGGYACVRSRCPHCNALWRCINTE